jgi:hypothetical protein
VTPNSRELAPNIVEYTLSFGGNQFADTKTGALYKKGYVVAIIIVPSVVKMKL